MISEEQYRAIKPIYEAIASENEGSVSAEELIARIDADPTARELLFNAEPDAIIYHYKLQRVNEFVDIYALRISQHIIGVVTRKVMVRTPEGKDIEADIASRHGATTYRPADQSWHDALTAETLQRYFRHGLSEICKHAPYCESWGQNREALRMEIMIAIDKALAVPESTAEPVAA